MVTRRPYAGVIRRADLERAAPGGRMWRAGARYARGAQFTASSTPIPHRISKSPYPTSGWTPHGAFGAAPAAPFRYPDPARLLDCTALAQNQPTRAIHA